MGLKDFLPGAGKGPEAKVRGQEPAPEKRKFENWLAQVPSACRALVENIARDNHYSFREKFPKLEDFTDAVAEGWVKKKEAFEVNMREAGFTPIAEGTDPRVLHGSILAYLTESGSWVMVGPGAFNKSMRAAAIMYTKIPFRVDSETPPDTEEPTGFAFNATPRVGERITPAFGSSAPFIHTSAVISSYKLPSPREGAFEKMRAINKGLVRKLEQVNADAGLALVRPKT